MRILITGPQASGKTTQTHAVAQALGFCEIDSGDLIREFAKDTGEENLEVKRALDEGHLIDNLVAAELVSKRLSHIDCEDGVVVDGYPRSLDQLKAFDPGFDKVFYLEVPDEISVQRALSRRRIDDTPELIKERLKIYHQITEELLKYFEREGILVKIKGTDPVKMVTENILRSLK